MNYIALDQGAGKSSVNTTVEHSPTLATTHQGEPAIALDGDKLKPREDQRKGGNVIVSTNSNGEDVAPTLNTAMAKLGGDNQTTFGGGYCITRREDSALTDSGSTETGR